MGPPPFRGRPGAPGSNGQFNGPFASRSLLASAKPKDGFSSSNSDQRQEAMLMRPGQNQKNRQRGRGRHNGGGGSGGGQHHQQHQHQHRPQNILGRTMDSNGPDVKIRGTPAHIYEKYLQLARDAHSGGDRVQAENYLQHAEHYYRLIMAAQAQLPVHQQRQPNANGANGDDDQQQPAPNGNGEALQSVPGEGEQPVAEMPAPAE